MTPREQYEARKSEQNARREQARADQKRAADAANTAQREDELNRLGFRKHPDRIVRYTGWLQLFTGALFLATLLLFSATVISAVFLHSTDIATHDLASAAIKQAGAAANQVAAMRGQLEEMKNTSNVIRLEQRAWIAPRGFAEAPPNFRNHVSRDTEGTLSFENIGKVPAVKVAEEIYPIAFPLTEWNNPTTMTRIIRGAIGNRSCKDVSLNLNGRVAWPGATVGRVVLFSEEDATKINARTHYAMLAGCIVYETLSDRHETEVCVILEPVIQEGGWRSVNCIVHNQAN